MMITPIFSCLFNRNNLIEFILINSERNKKYWNNFPIMLAIIIAIYRKILEINYVNKIMLMMIIMTNLQIVSMMIIEFNNKQNMEMNTNMNMNRYRIKLM